MQFQKQKFPFADQWLDIASLHKSFENTRELSKQVQKLSDTYVQGQGSPRVWQDPQLCQAYLSYFFILNSTRLAKAMSLTPMDLLFKDIKQAYELGSGPGTAHLSFESAGYKIPWIADEASSNAQALHLQICKQLKYQAPVFKSINQVDKNSLGIFSYVLTETELPQWALDCESLFVIEASMRTAARGLMNLRQKLISNDFEILAPCTHQEACPLLMHTKKDFCHFRVHLDKPDYFLELEKHLPMKNDTLTYSFLAARKKTSSAKKIGKNIGRIVGEAMIEKGKIRQAFCRSEKKEQLSWLRRGNNIELPESGQLYELPEGTKCLGAELRVTQSKNN